MACDDEIIPSRERIENVADDADLEEVYDSERHLLYVACTRARDQLFVTGVKPASEFLWPDAEYARRMARRCIIRCLQANTAAGGTGRRVGENDNQRLRVRLGYSKGP